MKAALLFSTLNVQDMKPFLSLAFTLFIQIVTAQRITISGFVKEEQTQEQLPGVNIYIPGTAYGTTTNAYGFYSLNLPPSDSATLVFSYVGYKRSEQRISLRHSRELHVSLFAENQLNEVVVKSERDNPVSDPQMSKVDISIQQIKKLPAFFGEKDVLKVLQLMPGVQKGTEGQTGLYVRGGGPDQNLIILDDAVVYNANHLFGFFSVFNSDAIKSVELTKGGFPARYGGRLSSVVEMNMKEGAKDKLHGEGGLGLLSSRLTLEGPIRKDRSSFLLSARRTYIDILARPIMAYSQRGKKNQARPGYYFYDLNAKMNCDLDAKNKLYISGYFGRDKFYVHEKSKYQRSSNGLDWGNATGTMRWNHLFSQKLFANTSLIFSNFRFGVTNEYAELNGEGKETSQGNFRYNSKITDLSLKTDFDHYPTSRHSLKFGLMSTFHRSVPSALAVSGLNVENTANQKSQTFDSFETSIYVEDTWQLSDFIKANAGLRLSALHTQSKTYLRPEPRWSAAIQLASDLSMKLSYATMNQYVHLLSNTGIGLPTDLWIPATKRIAPQRSEQFAGGFVRRLPNLGVAITLEGYYKKMRHILSYKEGASFLNVEGGNTSELDWQENVTAGKGHSYGSELLVQKKSGRLLGWIAYTLSWTQWQFADINFGKPFYPRHDRRHDLSLVGIYELNKNVTVSGTWIYGTGNALTLPISRYTGVRDYFFSQTTGNDSHLVTTGLTEYSGRSNFRAESFHRLDAAVQFHKRKKRYERTLEISVYNAYNRKNPFFYDIDRDGAYKNTLKKYSLFPVLPSVSYNFKF